MSADGVANRPPGWGLDTAMKWFLKWFVRKPVRSRHRDWTAVAPVAAAIPAQTDAVEAPVAMGEPSFPTFMASAIDRPKGGVADAMLRARMLLREVFTPSQPVTSRARFAGRLEVLMRLIEIIEQQRSHVVIYGERGIGKTSLLHVLSEVARESNYLVSYASCSAQSRFDEFFRAVFSDIPLLYHSGVSPIGPDAQGGASLADRLPPGEFNARQLSELCTDITGTRILIILDEYDRIEDPKFRQSVAELIKNLSDRAARVQLVLAGVASNLQELIGYIPSIRRNIIGLPMPRMTSTEVSSLIHLGESAANVKFDEQVIETIGRFSYGSPYLVRLLSHHAAMAALDDGRFSIELSDVSSALDKVVDEAESRVNARAVGQVTTLLGMSDRIILGGIARGSGTPDGWFTIDECIRELPGTDAATIQSALDAMTGMGCLTTAGGDPPRYRFEDDALSTYLQMRIAQADLDDAHPRAGVETAA